MLLKDKVGAWRARNLNAVAEEAERCLTRRKGGGYGVAHPRLVWAVVENGSWADEQHVQAMWGGLLAASCTEGGRDQGNLIFVRLLSELTPSEVKLLSFSCEAVRVVKSMAGWITAEKRLDVSLEKLREITGHTDIHEIDLELDHLRTLGLIVGGFNPSDTTGEVTPSSLALQLYARGRGFSGSVEKFFGL